MSVADVPVLPEVPDAWFPEDAVVFGVARHRDRDDVWEVVLPAYSIVGRGSALEYALREAGELLDDYFRLCVRDGLTFDRARRPISRGWLAGLILSAVGASIARRLHHTRSRIRVVRVPARHAFC